MNYKRILQVADFTSKILFGLLLIGAFIIQPNYTIGLLLFIMPNLIRECFFKKDVQNRKGSEILFSFVLINLNIYFITYFALQLII